MRPKDRKSKDQKSKDQKPKKNGSSNIDILLIDPPWIIDSDENLWKNVGSCLPSLGLAYIASYLEKQGYKVKILDCTAQEIAVNDVPSKLESFKRRFGEPRFLGLTATTALITNALAIAKFGKDIFPGAKVVLGGVHPSVETESTLKHPYVDYVVNDEGEITAFELVSGKPPADILGLSYKKDGKMVHNARRPLIKDLNEIPPPAYHLLPMKKYYPALGSYKRLPAMSIFATRGCPGRCTFCHRTFYGTVRPRSARNIIDEIKLLQERYGIREIQFYDDTFTLFKKVVYEFCDIVKKEKIDISWSCFTRVDYVEKELLARMKESGCHLILFGVESADEGILKAIKKNIDLDKAVAAVKDAREVGIETRASFMFGNQGETEETIKKSIDFALELDPDEVQFNIATAYPGTELYTWAKEKGYLISGEKANWAHFNMSDVNLKLPSVSQEVLKKYYSLAHRRFYFRPKIILRRILKIRTMTQFMQEVKGFFAIINIFKSKKEVT